MTSSSKSPSVDFREISAGGSISTPASGPVTLPGSKSITQRYFNLALLGGLDLSIRRPLLSEDTRLFLGALETCGYGVEIGDDWNVRLRAGQPSEGGEIFCGNGGTMFRFLTAALTTIPGRWVLDGVPRLRERPVDALIDCLRQLGANIVCTDKEGYAPLVITGGTLKGGEAVLDASASSQFLSAVLMATLAAERPTTLRVSALTSAPYVDLTMDAIRDFGGRVRQHGDIFHVNPSELAAGEVEVEADYSAVAYPAAAAALAGGTLRIAALHPESRQGDRGFIDLLGAMGADLRWVDGELEVSVAAPLRGITADLSHMPDQVPTLAALAPFASGVTRITNVPHLRIKESDRLAAMARELGRVGAKVQELADGLVIPGIWHGAGAPDGPKVPTNPVDIETYGDHRIAMSMALVGLRRPGLRISHPGVVAKSYPAFWKDLESWIA